MSENKRGHNSSPEGFINMPPKVDEVPSVAPFASPKQMKANDKKIVESNNTYEEAAARMLEAEENKKRMESLLAPLTVRDDGTGFYYTEVSRGRRVPEKIEQMLFAKLLAYGGGEECLAPQALEENCPELLERGFFSSENVRVRLWKGRPNNCHGNSAILWGKGKGRIVSGYALSKDGLWRQHSWVANKWGIIETTALRVKYYGYTLNEEESKRFAYEN